MAVSVLDILPGIWTELTGSHFGATFQVITDRDCYFTTSATQPDGIIPDVAAYRACPGVRYNTTSSNPDPVWIYAPDGALVSWGPPVAQDVYKQDQTSRPSIVKFNQIQNSTTLSVDAVKGAYTITVTNMTGFVAGRYIILFHVPTKNYSFYNQVGAPVGNVITLDSPLDFSYPAGTNADACITNLNVNGSVNPQTFGIRGPGIIPGVELTLHATGIGFFCVTSAACDLSKFGNLAALLRGVVLRKRDGKYENLFNIKSNADFAGLFSSFEIFVASNPAQNVHGFNAHLHFEQDLTVVYDLPIGEDIELIIQDDLTGLTSFGAYAIGHEVQ